MITVCVAIGNSDDKLTQREWAEYVADVGHSVRLYAQQVHADWRSDSAARWQNAGWLFELDDVEAGALKLVLAREARAYRQDSIAWLEGGTQFIEAAPVVGVIDPA